MLPIQEALSGILGSISLASWGSVFVPQLIENYRQQSAEALSLLFIIIWFVGDALNFIGAVWAGLVPIVIANGVCYCVTDCIMLIQCIYYKSRSRLRREIGIAKRRGSFINNNPHEDEELRPTTPLIPSRDIRSIDSEPLLPGRGREKPYKRRRACDSSVVKSVLAIIALGSAGWMVAYRLGFWQPSSTETPHKGEGRVVGAQIMGYMSALVSLGARLPQIYKNIRTKDCEGLSPSFIVLSFLGNVTIGGSVLSHSFQRDYIIMSLPWLVGSFIPALQDLFLLAQIQMYTSDTKPKGANSDED